MNKQDIREYTDNELSLLVFNDEYLYVRRHKLNFLRIVDDMFIYTEKQLEVLKQDLADEFKDGV